MWRLERLALPTEDRLISLLKGKPSSNPIMLYFIALTLDTRFWRMKQVRGIRSHWRGRRQSLTSWKVSTWTPTSTRWGRPRSSSKTRPRYLIFHWATQPSTDLVMYCSYSCWRRRGNGSLTVTPASYRKLSRNTSPDRNCWSKKRRPQVLWEQHNIFWNIFPRYFLPKEGEEETFSQQKFLLRLHWAGTQVWCWSKL